MRPGASAGSATDAVGARHQLRAVSAFLWGGTPRQILNATVVAGQCQLYTSGALLAELEDVLTREKFRHRLAAVHTDAAQLIAEFSRHVTVVHAINLPAPACPDPDDDHVLACALAAKAEIIVSGDRHLLDLKEYQGIRIVTATEAVRVVA